MQHHPSSLVRVENGHSFSFGPDENVRASKWYAPAKWREKESYLLDAGDFLETSEGPSQIVSIQRDQRVETAHRNANGVIETLHRTAQED
jgi:hypothetical protein